MRKGKIKPTSTGEKKRKISMDNTEKKKERGFYVPWCLVLEVSTQNRDMLGVCL